MEYQRNNEIVTDKKALKYIPKIIDIFDELNKPNMNQPDLDYRTAYSLLTNILNKKKTFNPKYK